MLPSSLGRIYAERRASAAAGSRSAYTGSGKEAVSPSPPPLRTARASFPACRSSRLTGSDALSVSLTMTSGVEPLEVLAFITSPGLYREEVMEVDLLSIEQGLSTPRTLPMLGFGYCIEHAAFGHALTTHLPAP